jgi:hypothetical protein
MHSNFITPPDFVDDQELHTVTVVDATVDDVELLARMCENSDEMYNIYLYRDEMQQPEWLAAAALRSDAVIVNVNDHNQWLCGQEKTYYYGPNSFLSPAKKVNGVMDYFLFREQPDK